MSDTSVTEADGGGNPSIEMPSFSAFVRTDACRQSWGRDERFYERLMSADVGSLNALKQWAKERYPDHYSSDWRKTVGKPYSREAMGRLWASYLDWKEKY